MMDKWRSYLEGGDLRSIADVEKLIPLIRNQTDFDRLFKFLYFKERLIVMRAADAIEKVTAVKPKLLSKHKNEVMQFLYTASGKEFKWHLTLMIPRLEFSQKEFAEVWNVLSKWAKDKKESKIVRVNSIQSLFYLTRQNHKYKMAFQLILKELKSENIPSINARLKKIELA